MTETALQRRLDAAIALATEAGRLALRLRPPPGTAWLPQCCGGWVRSMR